jgi:hypothetical protein
MLPLNIFCIQKHFGKNRGMKISTIITVQSAYFNYINMTAKSTHTPGAEKYPFSILFCIILGNKLDANMKPRLPDRNC